MRNKRPIINYSRISVEEFILTCRTIIQRMTTNLYFPDPNPTLAEIIMLTDDLEQKDIAAKDGGRLAKTLMRTARKLLELKIRSLGLYVDRTSEGNENMMVSSGFSLTKDHNPRTRSSFWVKRSAQYGEIRVGCARIPKSKAYLWQYFIGQMPPEDEKLWTLAKTTTQIKTTIDNFSEGDKVWVRCCGVTHEGMTAWREPISTIVG
jgi:hypothetical protein